jgi:SulP family sulfate permease
VFLTESFYFLPRAVLASIILTAVSGLIDVAALHALWSTRRMDAGVAGITFAATLALGIQLGMGIGITSSLIASRITPHLRDAAPPHPHLT